MDCEKVIVPPYDGVPELSHQFLVDTAVVVVETAALDVVAIGVITVVVPVGEAAVVVAVVVLGFEVVGFVVVVGEEQDANTSDVTIRTVSAAPDRSPFSFDLHYLPYYFVNLQTGCVRLALPLSPINPRAPSREGTTTNLAVSPTTNLQNPELPWQNQSYCS